MTITEVAVKADTGLAELIDAYAAAHHVLGGADAYQRLRLRAARRFLADHPDLGVWMVGPLPQRLADVSGSSSMWPLVTFALISTRVQADAEFLLTKGFGHSMRRWVCGLYPNETRLLHAVPDASKSAPSRPTRSSPRDSRSRSRSLARPRQR